MKKTRLYAEEPTTLYNVTFTHIHFTNSFTIMDKHPKTTHACLRSGYWCLSNFLERPLDIISYVKGKKNR